MGGIFLVFGIATLEMYVGIIFLIVSVIAITYASGTEIDYQKHEIRQYTKFLWKLRGKWMKLSNYQRMMVRKTRKGIRQYGRSTASTSRFYTYYDVLIIPDDYHNSIMLFTSRDKDVSQRFAEKWSKKLNIPIYKGVN